MPTRLWASTSNLLSLGRSSIHGLISARGETCPESRSGFRDRRAALSRASRAGGCRLDITLAVNPHALHHLKGVLLVFVCV